MCADFTKKCPVFGKKNPVCEHLWVKFSYKMQFIEYPREKSPKCFSELLLYVVHERLSKCSYSKKSRLPRKIPGCAHE